jgi:hypothetical protein
VPQLFESTRDIAWDKYLGELSYPLYICHFLFGWILLPQTISGVYLALFLSVATSILLYHLVDRPVDKWRQSRFAKTQRAIAEGRLIQAAENQTPARAGAIDAALPRQSPQRRAIKPVTISVAAKPVGAPTSG